MNARRPVWIIGLLFVCGLGLTFAPSGWLQPLKSTWWRIIGRPSAVVTQQASGAYSGLDIIRNLRELTEESARLEADNLTLKARVDSLLEVEHENELLRGELGFVARERDVFDFIPAEIISRSPLTYLQSVVVNRGTREGVTVGLVATSNGFVIGRVEAVTETSATIRLITASRSLIPITLMTSRATGLLKGGLAGITAEDLPSDLEIVPGEEVITSGLGQEVPAGLPLGTVDHILSGQTDFIQRAAIHSPIKFSKLETINLVKPKTP